MSNHGIVGQDQPIALLQRLLQRGCMQGAYLFSGPEGVGKRQVALSVARSLNCASDPFRGCQICPSCRKILAGQHPDVVVVGEDEASDDESQAIKIERVRELQQRLALRSYEGKVSVCIIDNAHFLTAEAGNALLKTLEEPARNCVIILVSSKPEGLLKTIVSRCRIIRFSAMPQLVVADMLERDYGCASVQAHFLARYTQGRLGAALKLRDEGFFEEKNRLLDAFFSDNQKEIETNRQQMRLYIGLLVSFVRDMYVLKQQMPDDLLIHRDRSAQMYALEPRFSLARLDSTLQFLSDAAGYVDANVNPRLLVATLCSYLKG